MQKIQWPKIKLVQFLISLVLLITIQVLMIRLLMNYEAAGFYLAHNGALLFVQLALVALFSRMPSVPFGKFNKVIDRLGNATLSIFVLHLPLFYLFSKLEKIIKLNLAPDSSISFFQRLKEVELSLVLYPLIITAIIIICVFIQENFVLKVRHPLRRFVERIYSTSHLCGGISPSLAHRPEICYNARFPARHASALQEILDR
jgi:peptidoglycan/LPS O-acetylase OafA/YrhL